jgi:PIN domain nuclease of toxin-antitoxin system
MNLDLLFDTHSFIWWSDTPEKLSPAALAALEDEDNRLYLSDAGIWEMQIKVQLGKMKLKLPLPDLIESQKRDNGVEILHITTEHILKLDHLPFHHKDPFDRLVISQSIVENFTIVTLDSEFPLIRQSCFGNGEI